MDRERRNFVLHAVIFPASVEGEWIGHCVDLDVVTQGSSPLHTLTMLFEASAMVVTDDVESGHDPLKRRCDPDELERFFRIVTSPTARHGMPDEILASNDRHFEYAAVYTVHCEMRPTQPTSKSLVNEHRYVAGKPLGRESSAPAQL